MNNHSPKTTATIIRVTRFLPRLRLVFIYLLSARGRDEGEEKEKKRRNWIIMEIIKLFRNSRKKIRFVISHRRYQMQHTNTDETL
jgi:hypothetical protein